MDDFAPNFFVKLFASKMKTHEKEAGDSPFKKIRFHVTWHTWYSLCYDVRRIYIQRMAQEKVERRRENKKFSLISSKSTLKL